MPRLNLAGDAALGPTTGTSFVSWAPLLTTPAVTPAPLVGIPASNTCWVGPNDLGYQNLNAAPFLEAIDTGTDVQTTLDAAGANTLVGSEFGTWARWLGGAYLDSHGATGPGTWFPLAADPIDGRFLICPQFSLGQGLIIWDGTVQTVVYGGNLDLMQGAFRNGYVTWKAAGQQWVWFGGSVIAQLNVALIDVVVDAGWLVGWVAALSGLYLIAPGSGWALLISATGTDFGPAMHVVDPATEIYVASTLGPNELAADLTWYTIDPSTNLVNGVAGTWVNLLNGATSPTWPGSPVIPPPGPTPAPSVPNRSILRPRRTRRIYPDVNQMTDRAAQQSVAKAWDRMQSQQTTINAQAAQITAAEQRIRDLEDKDVEA